MAGPKRPTPPPRSSYPIDDTPDEEKTPVTSDPFVSLEHRSRRTHEDTKAALSTIQHVARRVEEIDQKVDEYVRADQQEHAQLRDAQQKSAGALRTISAQVAGIDKNQAVSNKTLDLIYEDVRSMKRIEEHRTKVTIETEAVVEQAQVKDAADSARMRRKRSLKILGIIGTAVGSGGILVTLAALIAGKC